MANATVVTCPKCHSALFAATLVSGFAVDNTYTGTHNTHYLELSCRKCLTPMQFEVQLVGSPQTV